MEFRSEEFMEFRSEDLMASDDEEAEALSFCDLVAERETVDMDGIVVASWDSNTGSEDFDFEFGRCDSAATYNSCPADYLFHKGCLLPLTVQRSRSESDAKISCSKSNENRKILNEKLEAWRIDSLDSQRMDFTQRNSQLLNSSAPNNKSKPKVNRNSSPSHKAAISGAKSSLKWQFFTLGLMKTPAIKLEDMRLRQGKTTNNNGVENSLKRSVSCNYEEKEVKFQLKSKSVKENMFAEEIQARSKGWKILAPLTSLNGCKASSNSVINCSKAKKRVNSRGLAEERSKPAKKPPLYADQNSLNFGSRSPKIAASAKSGRGGSMIKDRNSIKASNSRVEFHRLSLQSV